MKLDVIRLLPKLALIGKMSYFCANFLINFESHFNNRMEFRKKSNGFIFLLLLNTLKLEAHMMHQKNSTTEWKEENLPEFDELILSWNAQRPTTGKYLFYIRLKVEDWSPWLLYASWGCDGQTSYLQTAKDTPLKVCQDIVGVMEGKKASGFHIKITQDASLDHIRSLHVYTNSDARQENEYKISCSSPIYLEIPSLSQMMLNHSRHKDLCSPTTTTAVVRYLSNRAIDPIHFAQWVWDRGFDLFGHWVFNVAQASAELGEKWECWVERLNGFDDIYQRLLQKTPVIVSVRGPLEGSACPYSQGHLMAVIGYDPCQQQVLCMDPAFPSHDQTHVRYHLPSFLQAWNRRGKIAYIFSKN